MPPCMRVWPRCPKRLQTPSRDALELPQLPSFLPYLVDQKPRTPVDLIRLALALRTDRDVCAYRDWRGELSDELARGGNAAQKRAELEGIRSKLDDRFSAAGVDVRLSVETVALDPMAVS